MLEKLNTELRIPIFLICCFMMEITYAQEINFESSLSINNTGDLPHSSAMLDINADDKGILIPRMDTNTYQAIINPAEGLLIYDESNSQFVFYNGNAWVPINRSHEISDADEDTRITVEGSTDEDTIKAFLGGEWQLKLSTSAMGDLFIETPGHSGNTFFGNKAGLLNQGFAVGLGGANTFFGAEVGIANTIGYMNSFMGYQSGNAHSTGNFNSFYGAYAGYKITTGNWNTLLGFSA